MTDEEKKVVEEKRFCKHGGELGRFFTLTASIFLGVLFAILVAAALLRPQCPCADKMMPPPPMMERQIPMGGQMGMPVYGGHHFRKHGFEGRAEQLPELEHNAPQAPQGAPDRR